MERIDVFREALKERVCVCFDRKDDRTCGLPEGRTCAIEAHLPGIVKAIEAARASTSRRTWRPSRLQVCPNCNQDAYRRCAFRENLDCAVDNFLYLIVDVIEDVKRRQSV